MLPLPEVLPHASLSIELLSDKEESLLQLLTLPRGKQKNIETGTNGVESLPEKIPNKGKRIAVNQHTKLAFQGQEAGFWLVNKP